MTPSLSSAFPLNPRTLARCALVAGSLACSLTGAEATLRWFELGYNNNPQVSDAFHHHAHPRNFTFRSYDPWGEFGGHLVRYDSKGRTVNPRGDGPANREVAILGDSFVEAVEVPFDDSLVGQLQVAAAGTATVRNYGVASYSPLLYTIQWDRDIRASKPVFVVVVLFSNDIVDDADYARLAVRDASGRVLAIGGPPDDPLRVTLRRSYVARLGSLAYRRAAAWLTRENGGQLEGSFREEFPSMTSLTSSSLLTLHREVRASGARFALTVVPSRTAVRTGRPADAEFSLTVQRWAESRGVPFIDLLGPFLAAAPRGDPLFFASDIHWTPSGHRVAATAICAANLDLFPRCLDKRR